jgi:hypothetical protein
VPEFVIAKENRYLRSSALFFLDRYWLSLFLGVTTVSGPITKLEFDKPFLE